MDVFRQLSGRLMIQPFGRRCQCGRRVLCVSLLQYVVVVPDVLALSVIQQNVDAQGRAVKCVLQRVVNQHIDANLLTDDRFRFWYVLELLRIRQIQVAKVDAIKNALFVLVYQSVYYTMCVCAVALHTWIMSINKPLCFFCNKLLAGCDNDQGEMTSFQHLERLQCKILDGLDAIKVARVVEVSDLHTAFLSSASPHLPVLVRIKICNIKAGGICVVVPCHQAFQCVCQCLIEVDSNNFASFFRVHWMMEGKGAENKEAKEKEAKKIETAQRLYDVLTLGSSHHAQIHTGCLKGNPIRLKF